MQVLQRTQVCVHPAQIYEVARTVWALQNASMLVSTGAAEVYVNARSRIFFCMQVLCKLRQLEGGGGGAVCTSLQTSQHITLPLIFHTFSTPSKQSHYLLLLPSSAIDHRDHKGVSPFSIKPTRFSWLGHQSKQPKCV